MQSRPSLPPDLCLVGRRYGDKAACLGDLAALAAAALNLDQHVIVQALIRREALGSTGVGGGIALPHARLPSVGKAYVIFACLKEAIPFDAVDERPIDIVCLLLLPTEPASAHLALLSCWARILRDKTLATKIRNARTSEALLQILDCRQQPL